MVNNKIKSILTASSGLLLIAGLAVGIILVSQNQDIRSRASAIDPNRCLAGSVNAFKVCIDKLKNKKIANIEITNLIYCNATSICEFNIEGINQGQIFGTPGSDTGFIRTGKYDYVIFSIDKSSNIVISNLVFDDNQASPFCTYAEYAKKCKPQISITNSSNIVLDTVKLLNSKAQAITLSSVKNFTFRKSEIANTYLQGLWMALEPNSVQGAMIVNSSFHETGGSAVFLSGNDITVKNNVFLHNQWNPPWQIQGGQINIVKVKNLLIEGNEIANGKYDSAPWHITAGIEFNGSAINEGIVIRNNNIHDNSGWGIVGGVETGIVSMKDVVVESNKLKTNGTPMIYDLSQRNSWTIKNNDCNGASCTDGDQKLTISRSGINKTYNPWAVWTIVNQPKKGLFARLYYNGNQWGSDIRAAANLENSEVSFQIPSNIGPNDCNKNGDCQITVTLVDPDTHATSNSFDLMLPKY